MLLKNEPGNKQALDLEKLIDKALKKGKSPSEQRHHSSGCEDRPLTLSCSPVDGLVGMAIVGGIGLGLAGLAGLVGLAVTKGAAKS